MRFLLGGNENVLKLIMAIVEHIYECTKNHSIVYFKWVNCMVSESERNKAIKITKYLMSLSAYQMDQPLSQGTMRL